MLVRVLGSAAGGGFPQWNCGCPQCEGVRWGHASARPRLQESVAVSADGRAWVLLNASPDVTRQIEAFPALHPRGLRDTPIAAIVLTSGDVDHCLGLLCLRESQPLVVWSTASVRETFVGGNALARTLARFPGHLAWPALRPGVEVPLEGAGGPTGLAVTAIAVPGKPPLHLEQDPRAAEEPSVGLRLRDPGSGTVLAYFPGVADVTPAVREGLHGAAVVFFDGTFWTSEELVERRLASRRAEQMGHVPVGGPGGSLARLGDVRAAHRLYIHVNNTNPMLLEDSAERAAVRDAGWEVAHDGLEVVA